jgi:hypothetical protein
MSWGRCAQGDDTDGGSAAALSAQWDPNDAAHVVVAEASGALRSVRALDGSDGALTTSMTRYQLQRKGTALTRPWEQVSLEATHRSVRTLCMALVD